jgi:hypothetical protein
MTGFGLVLAESDECSDVGGLAERDSGEVEDDGVAVAASSTSTVLTSWSATAMSISVSSPTGKLAIRWAARG